MAEKFIMVSLEDEKAKKLAEVISNETSRKILNYLSENEDSESDIAKKLKVPASTVHYNIQHLMKSNLNEVKDFYWSDKGNKVNIYKVAKKLIVIAPKGTNNIKDKLKEILPVAIISGVAGILINYYTKIQYQVSQLKGTAERALAAPSLQNAQTVNYGLWFIAGAIFAIIVYLIWNRRR
ncbi:MAG: winged helix-turn-helix domain-containing protein [Candidatus Woesearchaeota archaeon]|nr:winged helix-turn-helix domain-containing protein [Candidatus Woesearchaeota archaeon]